MKRWFMCPKCGVKTQIVQEEPELVIHMCPISKDWYMTFSGSLLQELNQIADAEKISLQDLVHKVIEQGFYEMKKSNKVGEEQDE